MSILNTRPVLWARQHKLICCLILIAIATHIIWFNPNALLFSGDWRNWPDENVQRFFPAGYGSYADDREFGGQYIQIYFNFVFFLWGVIGKYIWASKATLMMPIALLSVLSPYFLAKEITHSKKVAFVAALFYGFSTIILKLQLAHLFIAMAFVLAPLILLAFIKLLRDPSWKRVIYFSLIYSLGCFYELRVMYIVSLLLFVYLLIFFEKKLLYAHKAKWLVLTLVILLLNSYWILPTIFGDRSAIGAVANRGLFGDQFFNIFYSFSAWDKYWNGAELIPFVSQPIPWFAWVIPIFSFLLLLYVKKVENGRDRKLILFFSAVIFIGVLLTKQSASPLPSLYEWLYGNFPGFNLFREASKFFILVLIGYLGLFSFALKYLIIENGALNKHLKYIALVPFCAIALFNAKPLVTGAAGWLFVSKTQPEEYIELNQVLKSSDEFFRTYWIPRDSQWGYYNFNKPKVSAVTAREQSFDNFYTNDFETNRALTENYADFILEPFERNFGKALADNSSIRYFILPLDSESDVYKYYGGNQEDYEKKVENVQFLVPLQLAGLNGLKVLENKSYSPNIKAIDQLYKFRTLTPSSLEAKFDFLKLTENDEQFNYTSDPMDHHQLTEVRDVFEGIKPSHIAGNKLTQKIILPSSKNSSLYVRNDIEYAVNDLKQITERLSVDSNLTIQNISDELLFSYEDPSYGYKNVISNGSLEEGLWEEKVGDCNAYDDKPILHMSLNENDKTDGNQALELRAKRHIACTERSEVPVKENSTYLLSFDYKSPNARKAAYFIGFNDSANTYLKKDLQIEDNQWNSYSEQIKIPEGATQMSLYVYAFADGQNEVINLYDNFSLIEIPDLLGKYYLVNEPPVPLEKPESVNFEIIRPTKKSIHIKGAKSSFFLTMSDAYSKKWRLSAHDDQGNGFLKDWIPWMRHTQTAQYHFQYMDFLNGWYVDVDKLCREQRHCKQNSDGSFDIEMVAEFTPQRWFYAGSLISGTTFVGCLGYLGWDWRKRRRAHYRSPVSKK